MTEMPDHESLLAARFSALATPDAGDWLDVRRRARRSRVRKAALLLAAAIAPIVVAAPAVGLPRVVPELPRLVKGWFGAELAPQHTQAEFEQLVEGAVVPALDPRYPERGPESHYRGARGKEHVLWVAPTARGGFCLLWITDPAGARRPRTATSAKPARRAQPTSPRRDLGENGSARHGRRRTRRSFDRPPHAGIRGWKRVRNPRRVGLGADPRGLLPLLDSTRAPRARAQGGRPRSEGSRWYGGGAPAESHWGRMDRDHILERPLSAARHFPRAMRWAYRTVLAAGACVLVTSAFAASSFAVGAGECRTSIGNQLAGIDVDVDQSAERDCCLVDGRKGDRGSYETRRRPVMASGAGRPGSRASAILYGYPSVRVGVDGNGTATVTWCRALLCDVDDLFRVMAARRPANRHFGEPQLVASENGPPISFGTMSRGRRWRSRDRSLG